jgi:hypothetical protein
MENRMKMMKRYYRWARIDGLWQVVMFQKKTDKHFCMCGNDNGYCKETDWTQWECDFKWGKWIQKPIEYENLISEDWLLMKLERQVK